MLPQRSVTWLAMMSIIMGSLVLAADDPPKKADGPKKPSFTISKETTYLTGPLREGGYIDYVAALDERMKQGVTPENNAMVLLVRALGPAMGYTVPEGAKVSDRYFKALGCEAPPIEGKYFRTFELFLKDNQKPAMEFDPLWNLLRRLASRPWSRKEYPFEASWIDVNAVSMNLAREASKRTQFYSPSFTTSRSGGYDGLFTVVNHTYQIRHLAELLLCHAMLMTNDGKFGEARHDILACHRLARFLGQNASVIDMLTGCAVEQLAIEAATGWLHQPALPPNLILEYQQELATLKPMAKLYEKVDGNERFQCLDTILLVSQHGFKYLERFAGGTADGFGFKVLDYLLFNDLNWDPALKKANAWHDRLVAALKNTDRTERVRAVDEIEAELKQLRKELSAEFSSRIAESKESRVQFVYDMTRCLLTPSLFKVQIAADRVEQHQRQLQLAIGLALYQRENGQYPEKLSELSPKYLPTIPLDLFSGKEVVYSRTAKGYRLYSVGPNGKDDGGVKDEDHPPKADDILLEVPLPEWKKK